MSDRMRLPDPDTTANLALSWWNSFLKYLGDRDKKQIMGYMDSGDYGVLNGDVLYISGGSIRWDETLAISVIGETIRKNPSTISVSGEGLLVGLLVSEVIIEGYDFESWEGLDVPLEDLHIDRELSLSVLGKDKLGESVVITSQGKSYVLLPKEEGYWVSEDGKTLLFVLAEYDGEDIEVKEKIIKPSGKRVARFTVGTTQSGWTAKDCDYLCDGTDDQEEINAAITALPATGGEIVILDGTYNITAKIDVTKDNVSIRGNGNATILKRMYDSLVEEGIITLTNRSGCKIANLRVDGNITSYLDNYNCGIYLNSSSDNTVTGNTCNNSNRGIELTSSSDNTVTGNTCNNNNYGLYLTNLSGNNTVTGNTCNNNTTCGIFLSNSSNNTVTGNTCNNNNYYGLYLTNSSNNTVTGNTCNDNDTSGIFLTNSSNNTVTGNTCNNNNYGIYLTNLSGNNNTVTGNTCNNNTTSGIFLNTSSNNTVTGNTCIRGTGLETDYSSSQNTIRLQGAGNNYNLISNNNCMGKAVTAEGGTGNTLVNNKFDET